MCGIAGFTWSDEQLIRRMANRIIHRGPDAQGFYVDERVSLGHRRLSIIDLTEKANQPLYNEDKSLVLICNGEIYNYKSLREHLLAKGHRFYTESDSEVIVHAFEEFGIASFSMLDGMFAFALYDIKKRELLLVIDHLAIKNVYYALSEDKLLFASECKALFESKLQPAINKKTIENIATYGYNPNNETPFFGIKKLEPGTFLRFQDGTLTLTQYHQFKKRTVTYTSSVLFDLLDASIKKWLVADVPVAVVSSGGLDSSIVAACAVKYNPRIKVFSLGFTKDDNEFYYSRLLAKHLGLDYTEILLEDFAIEDDIKQVLYHQETPQDTGSMLAKWYLAREISKRGYKVVIGGSGADETWFGYTRHEGMYSLLQQEHKNDHALAKSYFDRYIMRAAGDEWLYDYYLKERPWYELYSYFDLFHEIPYYHNVRLDKMFMAWGIEYRVPFLDKELVEYSLNVPFALKLKDGKRKCLLKEAVHDLLPKEIIERPKQPLKVPLTVKDPFKWQEYVTGKFLNVFGLEK